MEYRSSEIKAGAFIFVSFIVMVAMIFMLGNLQDRFKPKKKLRIAFNYTGGLETGAPVRYAGLAIGRVVKVELADAVDKTKGEQVLVVTSIDPAISIKKDSFATIKSAGMMGALYIDIRPGTADAGILAENEHLQGQDAFEFAKVGDIMVEFVAQIERFTNIAETLASDSKTTLSTLQGSLANIDHVISENRESIHSNLKNMSKVSAEMASLMDKNDGQIRQTLTHISSLVQKTDILLNQNDGEIRKTLMHASSLAQRADTILQQNEQGISDIIDQTQKVSREVESLLADNRPGVTNMMHAMESSSQKIAGSIDSVAGNLDQTLKQTNGALLENRRNLLELTKNLKETSESLKEFSDDIKRNPWKLIRKSDEQPAAEPGKSVPINNQDSLRMKRLDKVSSK